jgi:hypothetical protein
VNLLEQSYPSFCGAFSLSSIQSQADGIVGGFISQATDWKNLSAVMAGGIAYRLGRVGGMAAGTGRLASVGVGLASEVSAFEMTNRFLTGGGPSNPNLWRWNGRGGLKEGWFSSFITFGTLKGLGRLTQGQNVVLQHASQDLGMVLGHQLAYGAGIGSTPQGTLAEQLLHAEVTNLQVVAGASLGHGLTGGSLNAMEQDLAFSIDRNRRDSAFESLLGKMVPPARAVAVSPSAQDIDSEASLGAKMPPEVGEGNRLGDEFMWMNISTEQGLLIAAGILGATSLGSWLIRTLRADRKDTSQSKVEFFYIPSKEERELLKSFFQEDVPPRFRLEDWEKINQRVYDEACDIAPRPGRDGLNINIKNRKLYDLYIRIVEAKLKHLSPTSKVQQESGKNPQERKKDFPSGPRPRLNLGSGLREIPVRSEKRSRGEQETLPEIKSDSLPKKNDSSGEKGSS